MHRELFLIFGAIFCTSCDKVLTNFEENCGVFVNEANQFPWEVSIYAKFGKKLDLRGVGALISTRHVLSLASTVSYTNAKTQTFEALNINNVRLTFGKTQNDDINLERDELKVAKIIVHNQAKFDTPPAYDIAVIYLNGNAKISHDIMPVCLQLPMSEEVRNNGLIAFSMNEEDASDDTTEAPLTDDDEKCKIVLKNVKNETIHEYFCVSGQSRMKYDDLYYVKDNKTGKWFLSGILNSMMKFDDGTMDTTLPMFYENMEMYSEWIENQISAEINDTSKISCRLNLVFIAFFCLMFY